MDKRRVTFQFPDESEPNMKRIKLGSDILIPIVRKRTILKANRNNLNDKIVERKMKSGYNHNDEADSVYDYIDKCMGNRRKKNEKKPEKVDKKKDTFSSVPLKSSVESRI